MARATRHKKTLNPAAVDHPELGIGVHHSTEIYMDSLAKIKRKQYW